jgi:hypothetical protein
MVKIDDCSSKHPLPQPLKGKERLPDDITSSGNDESTAGESHISAILAKSVVAAKMQIVSGMDHRDKVMPQPEVFPDSAEDPSSFLAKQRGFNEHIMIQNLKAVIADDGRWELFALGALGLKPGTEVCDTLRSCLQQCFYEDNWDGLIKFAALHSKDMSKDKHPVASIPNGDASTGLIERTKLWLTYTHYFETLFRAVKEKNLSSNIDLYTDERLIRYLDTIGQ